MVKKLFLLILVLAFAMSFASAINVSPGVSDSDIFYSNVSGNSIVNLVVSITNNNSNIIVAYANFTNISSSCGTAGIVNLGQLSGNTWNASCNVGNAAAISNFVPGVISFVVGEFNGTGINLTSMNTTQTTVVLLYNMTRPSMSGDACNRFGTSTTDLSTVTNFSAVNFVVSIQTNFSCMTLGILNGTNPGQFEDSALLNLTSIDMTNQTIGTKLAALQSAINVSIARARTFASSRIFVNSTAFTELNSSGTVTLFNLPFTSKPGVLGDDGVSVDGGNINWYSNGYSSAYGVNIGNLTFAVGHFSGYNATDSSVPLISVTPTTTVTSTTSTISVDVDGTGTEPSYIKVVIGQGIADIIYNATIGSNTNCTNLSSTREIIRCTYTGTLTNNLRYSINVSAWDYGGTSGNFLGSNNSFFVNTTTTTTASSSSSSTDSGDGETDSDWFVTYYPYESQMQDGYTKSLAGKYKISFKVNNVTHYVGLLSLTNTTVRIQVASSPQEKTLNIGDEWKVDLNTADNVNIYEVYIKLNSINFSRASVTVKKINESYASTPVIPKTIPPVQNQTAVQKIGEAVSNTTTSVKRNIWLWIIVIVLIVIIGLIVIFWKNISKSIWIKTSNNKKVSIFLRKK